MFLDFLMIARLAVDETAEGPRTTVARLRVSSHLCFPTAYASDDALVRKTSIRTYERTYDNADRGQGHSELHNQTPICDEGAGSEGLCLKPPSSS